MDPRRSEFLERSFRAATDRNASALQDFDSGIKHRTFERAQIGRRWNPARPGALKKIIAMPVFHGDDVEVEMDVILSIKKLREVAEGEPVATRQREGVDRR